MHLAPNSCNSEICLGKINITSMLFHNLLGENHQPNKIQTAELLQYCGAVCSQNKTLSASVDISMEIYGV